MSESSVSTRRVIPSGEEKIPLFQQQYYSSRKAVNQLLAKHVKDIPDIKAATKSNLCRVCIALRRHFDERFAYIAIHKLLSKLALGATA